MKQKYITPSLTFHKSRVTRDYLQINPDMIGGSQEGRGRNSFANERVGFEDKSEDDMGIANERSWESIW